MRFKPKKIVVPEMLLLSIRYDAQSTSQKNLECRGNGRRQRSQMQSKAKSTFEVHEYSLNCNPMRLRWINWNILLTK